MGVGMGSRYEAVVRWSMDGQWMGSWFPQSPGLPATVLCGILARGPALTVFDRKASSWSVAGGRPWGEPLDGLQLSAASCTIAGEIAWGGNPRDQSPGGVADRSSRSVPMCGSV